MIRQYDRPLGALEKVFWLQDQVSPVHFVMAAELNTVMHATSWRSALDATQRRHPLFSAGIDSNGHLHPFFRQDAGSSPIPLRIVESDDRYRWEEELEAELGNPFDWSQVPLARAVLVQQKRGSVFILAIHHAIADGISASYVIRDVLAALSGKIPERLPVPPSIDALLSLPVSNPEAPQPVLTGSQFIVVKRRTDDPAHIKRLTLSPSFTKSITTRARLESTTVHGALCSALVMAGRKINKTWANKPVRVVHPISVRRSLGLKEDSGLYITSQLISYAPGAKSTFWEMARETKAGLENIDTYETLKNKTTALQNLVFGDLAAGDLSTILQHDLAREMMLTNLGRLPYDTDFGPFKMDALWGPLALSGYPGDQTIGVSTSDGATNLIHVSRIPLPALLTQAENELIEACL